MTARDQVGVTPDAGAHVEEVERVVRTYLANVYCASCDWTTWRGGPTEREVVAYLERRLRAHVRRAHRTERPS